LKILIIGFSLRHLIPYIEIYENKLKEKGIHFDTILWDRYSNKPLESVPRRLGIDYIIHKIGVGSIFKKLLPMYHFRSICKKIIKKNNYTHLIVLTTLPGVFLGEMLSRNFRDRYILDIRDYSYEKYRMYRNYVNKLVDRSAFTAISSKGFFKFLAQNEKIVPVHNITNGDCALANAGELRSKDYIELGFVGAIRYYSENCRLLEILKNHPRYGLVFVGKEISKEIGKESLEKFCFKNDIRNVHFKGEYDNREKPKIYNEIDIIDSLYGSHSLEVTTLLPNRLYDAVLFKKPILASKGTYLADIVNENGLGIAIDLISDDVAAALDQYIETFNPKAFDENCQRFLEQVEYEQSEFYKRLNAFWGDIA